MPYETLQTERKYLQTTYLLTKDSGPYKELSKLNGKKKNPNNPIRKW